MVQVIEGENQDALGYDVSMTKSDIISRCEAWVSAVDLGTMTEEQASYAIADLLMREGVSGGREFEALSDAVADAQIPREVSYRQPIGEWQEDVAAKLKKREWERVVGELRRVRGL